MQLNEPGVVWYTSPAFQAAFHPSDDCCFGRQSCASVWHVLEKVRGEAQYEVVKASLERKGWVRPLPWRWTTNQRKWGDQEVRELIDGHNRASAAVELGLSIPLVEVTTADAVADDSGRWRTGDDIPRSTFDAMFESSQRAHPYPWAE